MMLAEKMAAYTLPQQVQKMGLYPYFRVIESEQDTVVKIDGKDVLMFGSNSYLGLTNDQRLKDYSKNAIDKYGSGCAGSRFLNGTLDIHLELEQKLAKFVNKDAAIVFSTGYQVNLGVISAIVGKDDYIITDQYNHACIRDGARLSKGTVVKYDHNDMASLEEALKQCPIDALKLLVVDGVFSMEGDLADLPGIVKLAKKYKANVMVDDAHGLGVMGKNGRGTADHFGLTDDVDLIMGTFSKSLASIGGFIASDHDTINFLKHSARSLIFSASIAPGNAASVIAALEILENEPERIAKLWENTAYAMELLKHHGFDTGHTVTPIIPIYIRDDFKTFGLTKELLKQGVFVNPVIYPAVPAGGALLRFSLMATHTKAQIKEAIDKMAEICVSMEILKKETVAV